MNSTQTSPSSQGRIWFTVQHNRHNNELVVTLIKVEDLQGQYINQHKTVLLV